MEFCNQLKVLGRASAYRLLSRRTASSTRQCLADILTAMRRNDLRRRHVEALLDRQSNEPSQNDATLLYTHNQDVESINNSKLAVLNGEEEVYEMILTGRSKAKETLLKSCLAPELLRLKVGALVMFVKNSQEKRYVNGTTGHILRFDKDTAILLCEQRQEQRFS